MIVVFINWIIHGEVEGIIVKFKVSAKIQINAFILYPTSFILVM